MKPPASVERLSAEIAKLPGVGSKSARRIAFHLVSKKRGLMGSLAEALGRAGSVCKPCPECFALIDEAKCERCHRVRDVRKICVVEEAHNIFSIESSGAYQGLYHVLQGLLSPMRGVHPEHVRLRELERRIEQRPCDELILALNPTLEGEATCHFVTDLLQDRVGKITRLAVGVPSGGDLEYSDVRTLSRAFENRSAFGSTASSL